jgi:phage gp29-like protein
MIDWCEASQSKAILGGTLTSQTGTNGNRSLGDVHNEVRLDIRNDDATQVDRSLSSYLIYPIAVINGLIQDGRTPDFVSDIQEPDDLALYADAIPKLVAVGAKIPTVWVSEKLKIPQPEGDEEILGMPAPAPQDAAIPPGSPPLIPTPAPLGYAPLAAQTDGDPTPVTPLTDNLEDQAQYALTTMIETVRHAVGRADSLEALRDDLVAIYGDLDSATLTGIMQMAFATADLAGRYDVLQEAGVK